MAGPAAAEGTLTDATAAGSPPLSPGCVSAADLAAFAGPAVPMALPGPIPVVPVVPAGLPIVPGGLPVVPVVPAGLPGGVPVVPLGAPIAPPIAPIPIVPGAPAPVPFVAPGPAGAAAASPIAGVLTDALGVPGDGPAGPSK